MKQKHTSDLLLWEKSYRAKGFCQIAGVDEAGRGPLAGPVVAAACILPEYFELDGLNDSKKVNEKTREKLFYQIQKIAVFGIGEATVAEIDQLNILQATFLAMQRAVKNLDIKPEVILVDGNASPDFLLPCFPIVKGDSKVASIATASILAKVTRDKIMDKIHEEYPMYEFLRHKGYGTKIHLEALLKFGPTPHHRMTFAPLKNYI